MIALGIIFIILYFIIRIMYISFVEKHSVLLSNIKKLNTEYTFYPFFNHDLKHTYDNPKFYNDISEKDYLIYQLQFQTYYSEIFKQIRLMNFNRDRFSKYCEKLETIEGEGKYNKRTKGYFLILLNHYEKSLYKKKIQSPTKEYSIKVTLFLSEINGEIYQKKSKIFYSNEIIQLIERLKNKSGTFYRDREIWESLCRVERGKVSNKLRFAIYKRDGYRCRYCHKSQSSTLLEVDHIIPIAKGGKSTPDNLQTLCHNCNIQKGDCIFK